MVKENDGMADKVHKKHPRRKWRCLHLMLEDECAVVDSRLRTGDADAVA